MGEPRLGRYQLLVELARGGMGIVYLAAAQGPGGFSKLLILKQLKPELVEDETFLSMFLEEARLAARLEHPNIVQTLEVGQDGNRHYIAMEYLQGQPLVRVRRRRPAGFKPAAELRVISEVLQGLHYAHTLRDYDGSVVQLVHRDISPHNIFLTYDGQAKIVDFGIAKASDTAQETEAGMFKGKAAYVAPEQVAGETLDPRTDVFAVGVMMWEAVAGQRLWQGHGDVDILKRLMKNDVPSIKAVKPDTPAGLTRIIEKAMAWNIEDRHASAEALGKELDTYLAAVGIAPTLREVGNIVAKTFEAEREQLRRAIEPRLAALKQQSLEPEVPEEPELSDEPKVPSLSLLIAAGGPSARPSSQPSAFPPGSALTSTHLASERSIMSDNEPSAKSWSRIRGVRIAVAACVLPLGVLAVLLTGRGSGGFTPTRAAAQQAPDVLPRATPPSDPALPSESAPPTTFTRGSTSSDADDKAGSARRDVPPRRMLHVSAPTVRPAESLPADAAPNATSAPPPAVPVVATPTADKPRVRIVEDLQRVKIVD